MLSLTWGFGLLLLVPVAISAEVELPSQAGPIEVQVDGRLLGGLVGVRLQSGPPGWRMYPLLLFVVPLPFLGMTLAREPSKTGPARSEQSHRDEGEDKESGDTGDKVDEVGDGGRIARAAGLLRFSSLLLPPGLQLLRSLAGALGLVRLRVEGRLGMGDPALTGGAYGLLEGLRGALRTRTALGESGRALQIEVTPEFRRKAATGRVDLILHLHLAYLLAVVLRFGVRVAWRWSVVQLSSLLPLPGFSAK